ncbi:glycoside hydrolase family 3 protein [Saccharata proteae CBS 121410]|uniref:beta-glucosidase n=1 Tax=Saccharata proteae CBS 121410 TaxID=1314787 RepID=A0A9P4M0F0_9PEZI|nr:glycoside hydrolase family 3 protein [Saccharata proteae CBS 121410]
MRTTLAVAVLVGASLVSSQASQSHRLHTLSHVASYSSDNPLWEAQSPPKYPSPWMDGSGQWAAAYEKAKAFVGQLTLLEKVNLTTGVGWEGESCVGNVGSIPRLGFPSLCMQDSPVGVRDTDYNSVFPAGGTVAASFDRGIWYQRGYDMGSEHREKGVDVQLGPVVGPIGRSPEGGRNWEGFSPDPVLSGIAVAQSVKGIQDAGVIACTKHFIAYEQEHFRQVSESQGFGFNITSVISSNVDDRTLHELYLWPFADAVRAGTGSIMCSYNAINGSQACSNSYTQNHLLKGELGFQGFIISDWQAQSQGLGSAFAGLDMAMPGDTIFGSGDAFWGANMTLAILNGTMPIWRLDDMATRIMAAYYLVGRDNIDVPVNFNSWTLDTYGYKNAIADRNYGLINQHVDVRGAHTYDIRSMAARSTVLLKNDGALPLTGKEKFTAVFGSDADTAMYGPNGCSDRGCDNGTLGMAWGSGSANFPFLVTPLTAIQNELTSNNAIVQSVTDDYAYDEITALAGQASTAIVFVNSDSGEGYIEVDGNIGDRNNLTLWHGGNELIANVSASCNNTIVVMHTTGAVDVSTFHSNPNVTAIIWAGIPGEQSGNSIADILYGRVNPGAKLPFTIGAKRTDYGTDVLYTPNNGVNGPQDLFTEGIFIDYRSFDKHNITPIYEFGYGLSYTSFSLSNLSVTSHPVGRYVPTTGNTSAAPTLGSNFSANTADYTFPANFDRIPFYIYPYLNSTSAATSYGPSDYASTDQSSYIPAGSQDGSPQPLNPAGGAPGGNPMLYDVFFTVECTVTNTGNLPGEEVPQLYISLGGPEDAKVLLRGFERLSILPGRSATFTADVTRRDLSNWDAKVQNWIISDYPKTVFVGNSSRNLVLSQGLVMPTF